MALSHVADCPATSQKVQDDSTFLATCRETFFALQVAKRECHAKFSSRPCLATLQVAGNAARVFVRCGVRLKRRLEPVTLVTLVLTKNFATNERTVGLEVLLEARP